MSYGTLFLYLEVKIVFVEERQALIYEECKAMGKVLVKDLSERFNVTPDLIRKDLTTLEQQGKLKKIYGGAILVKQNVHREIASQRQNRLQKEKQEMALAAITKIQPGSVIFLDISTTSLLIAKEIVERNIDCLVVTNMLACIEIFSHSSIKAILAGGQFDKGHDGFVGSLTNEFLSKFRFDIAFLGVVGLDLAQDSVMTYVPEDGLTKQKVLSCSRNAYMLCENEKLTHIGNYQYAKASDFTGWITDKEISEEEQKLCENYQLEIIKNNKK